MHEVYEEFASLVPGVRDGMLLEEALVLILNEMRRLKSSNAELQSMLNDALRVANEVLQ